MTTRAASWAENDLIASLPLRRVLGVLLFAVATAIGAKVALPIPGTPVPFTFQPAVVLLAGAVLGARLGMASQVAYLMAGVAGLPVFVAGGGLGYLLGPTGGYLLAYPLAAFLAGSLGREGVRQLLGLVAGLAAIYAGGIAWLAVVSEVNLAYAWGLRPFVLADLVKVGLVLLVALRLRHRAASFFGN